MGLQAPCYPWSPFEPPPLLPVGAPLANVGVAVCDHTVQPLDLDGPQSTLASSRQHGWVVGIIGRNTKPARWPRAPRCPAWRTAMAALLATIAVDLGELVPHDDVVPHSVC
jgi:hypothetical protein